jgi:hypothetical protein
MLARSVGSPTYAPKSATASVLRDAWRISPSMPSRSDCAPRASAFREGVAQALPEGHQELAGNPSFDEMLRSLGGNNLYSLYIHASQFTHGEHLATWLYRARGLGTEKRLGEFIEPSAWAVPFRLSWLSLLHPGRILLHRLGGEAEAFVSIGRARDVDTAIERVASEHVR